MYIPNPIDTTRIELKDTVLELVERLAENAHDNWAAQRILDGWTYGPTRDDQNKKHPCLLPYTDLPEAEKEYDRRISIETLKTIIAFGFRIEKE